MAVYRVNPNINFKEGSDEKILKLPSDPNGQVGSVWINFTEAIYGIQRKSEPECIGKAASHVYARLTTWNVEQLGKHDQGSHCHQIFE